MTRLYPVLFLAALLLTGITFMPTQATSTITRLCPVDEIAARTPEFPATGIILTQFDNASLWVYEVGRDRRYPLPDTNVCLNHCRLSPDRRWITYFNDRTNAFNRMTLLGTERALVAEYASDVEWWSADTFLIWTPARSAYLRAIGDVGGEREYLSAPGITSIQPGGRWGLLVQPSGDTFTRTLINLAVPAERLVLGEDRSYFNAHQWSPDGRWLAYVEPVPVSERIGSEIFGIEPGDDAPTQWTQLSATYGAARINGVAVGDLAWSPDGERLAFWVTPITGDDPLTDTEAAMIHILDLTTRELIAYCGYTTANHTPNPPHLAWSPDGQYLAFGGQLVNNNQAYMLLALDTETGEYTALSAGVSAALGAPDVVAWGLPPA